MSEAYFTNWLSSQPADERNHFHAVALHEARIATEHHATPASPRRVGSFIERLRAALPGTSPAQRCDCPAAA
jgi:hypothetical protein